MYTPVDPNDNNVCTEDKCDPQLGITNMPIPIPSDGDVCTIDSCDPITGVFYNITCGCPPGRVKDGPTCKLCPHRKACFGGNKPAVDCPAGFSCNIGVATPCAAGMSIR